MSPESTVVLVVGAASRDVVADDPRGWRLGGAVLFTSLALAHLGIEVWAVVGADAQAAEAREFELLRDAGVAMALADLHPGPVFNNVTHLLHSASDRIPLTAVPRRWTSGFDALLVVPVADEVGEEWAGPLGGSPSPFVALGWQGLLRTLVPGDLIRPRPPVPSPLLRAARLAVVSREDVSPETPPEAFLALLAPDATLVWTEGAGGGTIGRLITGCDTVGCGSAGLLMTAGAGGGIVTAAAGPGSAASR